MTEKKKIKDTKLGAWLSQKAPNILGVVGDLLPDSGCLLYTSPSPRDRG